MITRQDLLDAIKKCQGQKNPNANTCITLAAYYFLLDHLMEKDYSYSRGPSNDFMSIVVNKKNDEVMGIMDDLMEELRRSDS
mgnify:CR=1 FL=1